MIRVRNFKKNITLIDFRDDYGIIVAFIKYFGIIHTKGQVPNKWVIALIIPVLFHLQAIDEISSVLKCINEVWFQWKFQLVILIGCVMRLLVYHTLRRSSENVITAMERIKNISPKCSKIRYWNAAVIVGIVLLLFHSVVLTFLVNYSHVEYHCKDQLYDTKFQHKWVKNLCYFLKVVFFYSLPATVVVLILGLYLISCHKLTMNIIEFSNEIYAKPAYAVLKYPAQFFTKFFIIVDAAEALQNSFSSTSFCLCVFYLLADFSMISIFLLYKDLNFLVVFDFLYRILFITASLFLLYYFADSVPTQMSNLKSILYKKFGILMKTGMYEADQVNLLLVQQMVSVPDCVLSGCRLLFFTKTNLMAVIGTLVTYGLILVQLK